MCLDANKTDCKLLQKKECQTNASSHKIPPKKPENLAIRSNPVSASAHRWLGARASFVTGCLRDTLRPRACICILQFFICIVRFCICIVRFCICIVRFCICIVRLAARRGFLMWLFPKGRTTRCRNPGTLGQNTNTSEKIEITNNKVKPKNVKKKVKRENINYKFTWTIQLTIFCQRLKLI